MTSNCVICDETLNLKNHKLIYCEYCEFGACKTCYQTFLPEQNAPKCMNRECTKVWTRRFINATFSQSFLQKDWRKSREKLAFDRETAQLPATQEILERRLRIENAKRQIIETRILIKNKEKYYAAEYRKQKKPYPPFAPEELRNLRRTLDQLQLFVYGGGRIGGLATRPATVTHFVRGCPDEDCRGFLSSDWKCGLCYVQTCSKCHVIKNTETTEHTCNPDDVATATLLNRDTKPCPKCHTGIFKIDGCDQMWCTQCHTAFSWNTGALETHIHNPHYYEWQRRNNGGVAPRVPGDGPLVCAPDQPLNHYTYRHITGLQLRPSITVLAGNIIRDVLHLRETDIPTFRPEINENVFRENRIHYLKKDITKEIFIRRVLMENKKREINVEIQQVLEMFVQVSTDIIRDFTNLAQSENMRDENDRLKSKLDEIETLRQFTNEALKEIYTTFNYKVREISFMHDIERDQSQYSDVLKTVEKK